MSIIAPEDFLSRIKTLLADAGQHRQASGRPFCTLTYAQSLDGCIAHSPMNAMALSGREAMTVTHHLRAWHEAILVGIRTVIADNPSLTVRLVPGRSPQPVVLDSNLRMPLDTQLLGNNDRPNCWIAGTHNAETSRQRDLESKGAKVLRFASDSRGWVKLEPLLERIADMGVNSLMIEGGAQVLTSFIKARLVDQVIITLAPVIVGGVHAFGPISRKPELSPCLRDTCYAKIGSDLMLQGRLAWERA
jgi:GTP cyclohydrolase II